MDRKTLPAPSLQALLPPALTLVGSENGEPLPQVHSHRRGEIITALCSAAYDADGSPCPKAEPSLLGALAAGHHHRHHSSQRQTQGGWVWHSATGQKGHNGVPLEVPSLDLPTTTSPGPAHALLLFVRQPSDALLSSFMADAEDSDSGYDDDSVDSGSEEGDEEEEEADGSLVPVPVAFAVIPLDPRLLFSAAALEGGRKEQNSPILSTKRVSDSRWAVRLHCPVYLGAARPRNSVPGTGAAATQEDSAHSSWLPPCYAFHPAPKDNGAIGLPRFVALSFDVECSNAFGAVVPPFFPFSLPFLSEAQGDQSLVLAAGQEDSTVPASVDDWASAADGASLTIGPAFVETFKGAVRAYLGSAAATLARSNSAEDQAAAFLIEPLYGAPLDAVVAAIVGIGAGSAVQQSNNIARAANALSCLGRMVVDSMPFQRNSEGSSSAVLWGHPAPSSDGDSGGILPPGVCASLLNVASAVVSQCLLRAESLSKTGAAESRSDQTRRLFLVAQCWLRIWLALCEAAALQVQRLRCLFGAVVGDEEVSSPRSVSVPSFPSEVPPTFFSLSSPASFRQPGNSSGAVPAEALPLTLEFNRRLVSSFCILCSDHYPTEMSDAQAIDGYPPRSTSAEDRRSLHFASRPVDHLSAAARAAAASFLRTGVAAARWLPSDDRDRFLDHHLSTFAPFFFACAGGATPWLLMPSSSDADEQRSRLILMAAAITASVGLRVFPSKVIGIDLRLAESTDSSFEPAVGALSSSAPNEAFAPLRSGLTAASLASKYRRSDVNAAVAAVGSAGVSAAPAAALLPIAGQQESLGVRRLPRAKPPHLLLSSLTHAAAAPSSAMVSITDTAAADAKRLRKPFHSALDLSEPLPPASLISLPTSPRRQGIALMSLQDLLALLLGELAAESGGSSSNNSIASSRRTLSAWEFGSALGGVVGMLLARDSAGARAPALSFVTDALSRMSEHRWGLVGFGLALLRSSSSTSSPQSTSMTASQGAAAFATESLLTALSAASCAGLEALSRKLNAPPSALSPTASSPSSSSARSASSFLSAYFAGLPCASYEQTTEASCKALEGWFSLLSSPQLLANPSLAKTLFSAASSASSCLLDWAASILKVCATLAAAAKKNNAGLVEESGGDEDANPSFLLVRLCGLLSRRHLSGDATKAGAVPVLLGRVIPSLCLLIGSPGASSNTAAQLLASVAAACQHLLNGLQIAAKVDVQIPSGETSSLPTSWWVTVCLETSLAALASPSLSPSSSPSAPVEAARKSVLELTLCALSGVQRAAASAVVARGKSKSQVATDGTAAKLLRACHLAFEACCPTRGPTLLPPVAGAKAIAALLPFAFALSPQPPASVSAAASGDADQALPREVSSATQSLSTSILSFTSPLLASAYDVSSSSSSARKDVTARSLEDDDADTLACISAPVLSALRALGIRPPRASASAFSEASNIDSLAPFWTHLLQRVAEAAAATSDDSPSTAVSLQLFVKELLALIEGAASAAASTTASSTSKGHAASSKTVVPPLASALRDASSLVRLLLPCLAGSSVANTTSSQPAAVLLPTDRLLCRSRLLALLAQAALSKSSVRAQLGLSQTQALLATASNLCAALLREGGLPASASRAAATTLLQAPSDGSRRPADYASLVPLALTRFRLALVASVFSLGASGAPASTASSSSPASPDDGRLFAALTHSTQACLPCLSDLILVLGMCGATGPFGSLVDRTLHSPNALGASPQPLPPSGWEAAATLGTGVFIAAFLKSLSSLRPVVGSSSALLLSEVTESVGVVHSLLLSSAGFASKAKAVDALRKAVAGRRTSAGPLFDACALLLPLMLSDPEQEHASAEDLHARSVRDAEQLSLLASAYPRSLLVVDANTPSRSSLRIWLQRFPLACSASDARRAVSDAFSCSADGPYSVCGAERSVDLGTSAAEGERAETDLAETSRLLGNGNGDGEDDGEDGDAAGAVDPSLFGRRLKWLPGGQGQSKGPVAASASEVASFYRVATLLPLLNLASAHSIDAVVQEPEESPLAGSRRHPSSGADGMLSSLLPEEDSVGILQSLCSRTQPMMMNAASASLFATWVSRGRTLVDGVTVEQCPLPVFRSSTPSASAGATLGGAALAGCGPVVTTSKFDVTKGVDPDTMLCLPDPRHSAVAQATVVEPAVVSHSVPPQGDQSWACICAPGGNLSQLKGCWAFGDASALATRSRATGLASSNAASLDQSSSCELCSSAALHLRWSYCLFGADSHSFGLSLFPFKPVANSVCGEKEPRGAADARASAQTMAIELIPSPMPPSSKRPRAFPMPRLVLREVPLLRACFLASALSYSHLTKMSNLALSASRNSGLWLPVSVTEASDIERKGSKAKASSHPESISAQPESTRKLLLSQEADFSLDALCVTSAADSVPLRSSADKVTRLDSKTPALQLPIPLSLPAPVQSSSAEALSRLGLLTPSASAALELVNGSAAELCGELVSAAAAKAQGPHAAASSVHKKGVAVLLGAAQELSVPLALPVASLAAAFASLFARSHVAATDHTRTARLPLPELLLSGQDDALYRAALALAADQAVRGQVGVLENKQAALLSASAGAVRPLEAMLALGDSGFLASLSEALPTSKDATTRLIVQGSRSIGPALSFLAERAQALKAAARAASPSPDGSSLPWLLTSSESFSSASAESHSLLVSATHEGAECLWAWDDADFLLASEAKMAKAEAEARGASADGAVETVCDYRPSLDLVAVASSDNLRISGGSQGEGSSVSVGLLSHKLLGPFADLGATAWREWDEAERLASPEGVYRLAARFKGAEGSLGGLQGPSLPLLSLDPESASMPIPRSQTDAAALAVTQVFGLSADACRVLCISAQLSPFAWSTAKCGVLLSSSAVNALLRSATEHMTDPCSASGFGGPVSLRSVVQLLSDYSELKVTHREKSVTELRRAWIRQDAERQEQGIDTSNDAMPDFSATITRSPLPRVVALETAMLAIARRSCEVLELSDQISVARQTSSTVGHLISSVQNPAAASRWLQRWSRTGSFFTTQDDKASYLSDVAFLSKSAASLHHSVSV